VVLFERLESEGESVFQFFLNLLSPIRPYALNNQVPGRRALIQNLGESNDSLSCSKEPATGPYPGVEFGACCHRVSLQPILILLVIIYIHDLASKVICRS
jgi:hypothetical protein